MKTEHEIESFAQKETPSRACPVEFFIDENKALSIKNTKQDDDSLLKKLTGTPNTSLAESIICSSIKALPGNMDKASKYNCIHQTLADATPKDAHEARLSAQAAVLYSQGLDFLERARSVLFDDGTLAKDHWHTILMKTATKLLDLHAKTVEALVRYRQKGEQRIVVQHVTVQDGGKAIVGNLLGGGAAD